ncbi:MAG: ATP-binding protein [Bryobacterales bacterium]|nr:ATP-binding protein [Bryobacterales bacterium]
MIRRNLQSELLSMLRYSPATVLMGPRQVGKTTFALEIARERKSVYLDLERPSDLAKIADVEWFCELNKANLLILDEVQLAPNLFAPLRGIIDAGTRAGGRSARFLLLGSASIELLRQSSETLAGRVAYCELRRFDMREVGPGALHELWHRGGCPESFIADSDARSLDWRLDFIRTYLERHMPQLGPRIPAETLRRFWTMLAHNQGQVFNASAFGRGLGLRSVTISRYLDFMVDLLLVRRLQPWTSNLGKGLIRAPETYLRDSGIWHALLGIGSLNELLGHPVVRGSWEGFVIENIIRALPTHARFGYFRTSGGAGVDLVIESAAGALVAIEIKHGRVPSVSRGFFSACEDFKPTLRLIVHAGGENFSLSRKVEAVSLDGALSRIEDFLPIAGSATA